MDLDLSALSPPRLLSPRRRAAACTGAGPELRLERGATLALQMRPGACISVDAGRVWLTEHGDPGDHFIEAGTHHVVCHGGRVVIEGDSAVVARLRVRRG